jgi:cysteine-rich repeat protein
MTGGMEGSRPGWSVTVAVLVALGCDPGGVSPSSDASVPPGCGDGVVDPGEACDDGNDVDGDGCDSDCTLSCVVDADCDDGDVCNGPERCNASMHRCQHGTHAPDLTECTLEGGDEGACVGGHCGAPCLLDYECDDGDVCNGIETCDTDLGFCRPGPAEDCDDGERCTEDRCEPGVGCVHVVLHDADGDGYARSDVECDDPARYGGDCDDNDPDVHPGAPEICGNGIDDNCNGEVDENKTTWYVDCDSDGFAADTNGARAACSKPPDDGACTWTALRPVSLATTDCDDATPFAHPGGNETFGLNLPFCVGTGQLATGAFPSWSCPPGSHWSWDYDCNGVIERKLTRTGGTVCLETDDGCAEAGWKDGSVPGCGQVAEVQSCGPWGGECSGQQACFVSCVESGQACCSCTCDMRQTCR